MQQKKQFCINICIISAIALFIILLSVYVCLSPAHSLFNSVNAQVEDKLKVAVSANHIAAKPKSSETRFLASTPLAKAEEWQTLFTKGFLLEQQGMSAKPIMFGKDANILYYAYHIILVSENKAKCNYKITVTQIKDANIEILIGSWSEKGFVINGSLRSGELKLGETKNVFVVVSTAKSIKNITKAVQDKNFKVDIKISKS